jgi:hypothetical protein
MLCRASKEKPSRVEGSGSLSNCEPPPGRKSAEASIIHIILFLLICSQEVGARRCFSRKDAYSLGPISGIGIWITLWKSTRCGQPSTMLVSSNCAPVFSACRRWFSEQLTWFSEQSTWFSEQLTRFSEQSTFGKTFPILNPTTSAWHINAERSQDSL